MSNFIQQQQELARKIDEYYRKNFDESTARKSLYITELLTEYQIDIITNTVEELLRRAEGEKKHYSTFAVDAPETIAAFDAIDTLKKHITNVTGVE